MPPVSTPLAKAELRQLDANFNEINSDNTLVVQFNPETLKVSFANQLATSSGAGDQRGPAARQFVGAGTTKLSAQLWFDVTAPQPTAPGHAAVDDVRKLTQKVAFFITPRQEQQQQFIPPAVRFAWGSFQFDGLMDSMEESLEFFSAEGKPLRASVSIALSQQRIQAFTFVPTSSRLLTPPGVAGSPGGAPAGTSQLTPALAGSTLQGVVATQAGPGVSWQDVAAANNIENPRLLAPGQLIDLNVGQP